MQKEIFYERLPNELLGTFYCYLLSQVNKGGYQRVIHEKLQLIERTARKRGMTPIELRIIGYWAIQREKNLTKDENQTE